MPDDLHSQEIIPPHLSDSGRDGHPKAAQLRAGAAIAPIIPTSLEEAYRYAVAIIKAGLAPDSYNIGGNGPNRDEADPQKVLIGILKSLEVGLPPITGLSTIAIINKRPTIWGDGAVALVQAHGLVEKIEELWEGAPEGAGKAEITLADFPDSMTCVYRIWRRGQPSPYVGRFSVRDAKRAHLWGNQKRQPWCLYPKRMMLARARALALRDGFSDALAGLAIREEIEDLPPEAPAKADVSFLDDPAPQAPALAPPSEEPMAPPLPDTAADQAPIMEPVTEASSAAPQQKELAIRDAFWRGDLFEIDLLMRGDRPDWQAWAGQVTRRIREAQDSAELAQLDHDNAMRFIQMRAWNARAEAVLRKSFTDRAAEMGQG